MTSSYLPILILLILHGVQSRPQGSHEGQEQSRVAEVMSSLGNAVKGAVCKVLKIILTVLYLMNLIQFLDTQGSDRIANTGTLRDHNLVGSLHEGPGHHHR